MRRFVAGMAFLAMLAAGSLLSSASPVRAQDSCARKPGNSGFEKSHYEVDEAVGYVDLPVWADNLARWAQGQIDYETFALSAIGGQDFQHSSGTLTYTTNGSHDIRVPITRDDLVEGEERFEVRLTDFRGSFARGGCETAVVTIFDASPEQSSGSPASPDRSNEQAAESQIPSPPSAVPAASGSADLSDLAAPLAENVAPATSLTHRDPSADADELQPGPGFELASGESPKPAPERADGGGASASGLVFGLGTAAVSVGALALVWRRRRWSPTRA